MNITKPHYALRLEGLAFLLIAIVGYAQLNMAWWAFFAFFLLPDIAIAFYAVNPQIGSIVYNLAHTYTGPLALFVIGIIITEPNLLAAGLIWLGHIGMDRIAGYGLKYATNFKDTHLGRI